TFSDEDADEIAVITVGSRKDNVASATARRASHKASNPPGCPISYLIRRCAVLVSAVKQVSQCIRSSAG
ncbi:hypothetical protein QF11_003865, partial [Salmonella enterica subsp. salamae]|nr:hypothetical protein [Salmonella enterica subsp. salamae]